MLLLARLDTGRPMQSRPVDLSAIVVAALSDAHVASPDHNWNLSIPPDPVTVQGDPDRLAQVVSNLLANARVHTPAGTHINVELRTREPGPGLDAAPTQWATLTVQDNGPGIPPALVSEVFGRFSRGDTSRSRAAGSTGLGLAIVAAVVGAHGGSINVRSTVGDTVFTVRLPLATEADEAAATDTPL